MDKIFFRELKYAFMFKMPSLPLKMDTWTKCLDTCIFVS